MSPPRYTPVGVRSLAPLPRALLIALATLLVPVAPSRAFAPAAAASSSAASERLSALSRHDDTRLIVKLREAPGEGDGSSRVRVRSAEFEALMRGYGIDKAEALLPPRAVRGQSRQQARRRVRLENYLILRSSRPFDVEAAAIAFRRLREVESAEPDFLVSPAGTAGPSAALPDDPAFATYQWGLRNTGDQITSPASLPRVPGADIHAADAWAVTTGDQNVIVAVLDTGVRTDHPEFAGRIWVNEDEIPGNSIDDDENGYVDDVNGYNFALGNPSIYDDGGHGTAAASIIAANANNGAQIAGIDWSCRLMPVKVFAGDGAGSFSGIAQAVIYASDNGAKVVNLSLGGYGFSAVLQEACAYAHDAGTFLAAAMRNENTASPAYPAAFDPWVTAVGATDPADDRCTPEVSGYGSNYGPHIDVVAPGVSVAVLDAGASTGVALAAGTSFSTPMVAGLASLLFAVRPDLTADQVRDLIRYSAGDLVGRPAEDTPGFDVYHGWGRIDCGQALALAATAVFPTITVPAPIQTAEGVPIQFEVVASDPDGPIESLQADLAVLPSGPTFTVNADKTSGLFSWTPTYFEAGQYRVRFTAKNQFEASASTPIEILDVVDPPLVTIPLVQAGVEGAPLEAVITAADPDGDALRSLTGTPLPAGSTFTVEPDFARGLFAWTPGHAQAAFYSITFTVESLDPAGPLGGPLVERASNILRFLVREGPDQPPVLVAPNRVDGAEGSPLSVEVAATDADGAADPIVSLTAAPLPAGATFAAAEGNGSGTLAWTPDFQQAGSYEIRLAAESAHRATSVSDPVVTEVSALLTLVVADTPRPPTARPGGPYSGVIGVPIPFDGTASSDPDGTPLASFQWAFGDGVTGVGAAPSHTYAAGGSFAVSLTVSDGALEATAATSAAVSDLFAARAFPEAQDRAVRLLSAKPTVCLRLEAVGGSFENSAVDLGQVSLLSVGTGDVDRIRSVAGKGAEIGDADRNGISDLPVCFTKEDLRQLFSKLPAGKQSVPAALEAALTTGGRVRAEFPIEVVAPGGALATAVTPNPIRAGGVLSLRLNADGPVRFRIFDATGRLVRELASDRGGAGGYRDIPFDGRDQAGRELHSGIYFYRVESSSGRGSGRLAVLR